MVTRNISTNEFLTQTASSSRLVSSVVRSTLYTSTEKWTYRQIAKLERPQRRRSSRITDDWIPDGRTRIFTCSVSCLLIDLGFSLSYLSISRRSQEHTESPAHALALEDPFVLIVSSRFSSSLLCENMFVVVIQHRDGVSLFISEVELNWIRNKSRSRRNLCELHRISYIYRSIQLLLNYFPLPITMPPSLALILLLVLVHLQISTSTDCRCDCCLTPDCRPTPVGLRPIWFCSETASCTPSKCIEWYGNRCPPRNAFGQTRAICANGTDRLSSLSLLMIMSTAFVLLIKDLVWKDWSSPFNVFFSVFCPVVKEKIYKALLVFFLLIPIAPDRLAMIDSILTNREDDDDTLAEHLFEHVMPWHLREKYVLTRLSYLGVRLFCRKSSSFLRRIHFDHQLVLLPFGPPISQMNIWRIIIFILYSLVACFFRVFVSTNSRRSLEKIEQPLWNTTQVTITYHRPTTMPQVRLDWLLKFGLIKATSPSSPTTNALRQRTWLVVLVILCVTRTNKFLVPD